MSTLKHEWARVRDLLERAIELDIADRAQFLDQACAGDVLLRGELEGLLSKDVPSEAPESISIRAPPPS